MQAGYWRTAALGMVLTLVSSCSSGAPSAALPSPTRGPVRTAEPTATVDPAGVHANELGAVPVLMYHQLLARPRSAYDQTARQFRAELDLLYRTGYRTVTAADLVAGRLDVPAGRSPMVLTFDDSTVSQYAELPDGAVDPASAVGILLAVARRYGEDHPVATFYVNAAPFAGKDRYLAALHDLGMELGEHTASHANLRSLDASATQRELVEGLAVIRRAAPAARVTTMALPFGAHPRQESLAHRGAGYSFAGVLLVGSNPARSPYSTGFDPFAVPRIRSGTGDPVFTSTYWLARLRGSRYVSDGDPSTIAFPRRLSDRLAPRFAGRGRPY